MTVALPAAFAALFPFAVLFAPLLLEALERKLLTPTADVPVDDGAATT